MKLLLRAVGRMRAIAGSAAILLGASAAAQPCDSLLIQGFTKTPIGPYLYQFSPLIDTGDHDILNVLWQFSNGSPNLTDASYPIVEFPGQGYQLVCLTVDAELQGSPCQSTYCDLIDVPADTTGCGDVINDFTIEYNEPDIIFISTSSSLSPIDEYMWDFGDGNNGSGTPITHTYDTFGAYYVCLTIVSGNCTTTHCRWLYLGPAQLPCDTLLEPAFDAITLSRTVAVIDESEALGMDIQVTWDFGDGTSAFGPTAIHTYDFDGAYTICASVQVMGLLVQDSCVVTLCQDVQVFDVTAAMIDETQQQGPRVFPVPFEDEVSITWDMIDRGTTWQLTDLTGRCVAHGVSDRTGTLQLDLSHVAPGPLFIRLRTGDRLTTARLLKN